MRDEAIWEWVAFQGTLTDKGRDDPQPSSLTVQPPI